MSTAVPVGTFGGLHLYGEAAIITGNPALIQILPTLSPGGPRGNVLPRTDRTVVFGERSRVNA